MKSTQTSGYERAWPYSWQPTLPANHRLTQQEVRVIARGLKRKNQVPTMRTVLTEQ